MKAYLIIINILSFILYGIDKLKAIKKEERISEKTLILIGILGGSIGSLIGMNLFRHKTKKLKFIISLPLILIIHIIVVIYLF
jgi:hypothetical protein